MKQGQEAKRRHLLSHGDGGGGHALGGSISLQDDTSKGDSQEAQDLFGNGCRSGQDDLDTATKSHLNLVEQEAVPKSVVDTLAGSQIGHLGSDTAASQGTNQTGSLDGRSNQLGINAVQETGDSREEGGAELSDVLEQQQNVSSIL